MKRRSLFARVFGSALSLVLSKRLAGLQANLPEDFEGLHWFDDKTFMFRGELREDVVCHACDEMRWRDQPISAIRFNNVELMAWCATWMKRSTVGYSLYPQTSGDLYPVVPDTFFAYEKGATRLLPDPYLPQGVGQVVFKA